MAGARGASFREKVSGIDGGSLICLSIIARNASSTIATSTVAVCLASVSISMTALSGQEHPLSEHMST